MKKPEIAYPCKWLYKIIGSDRALITAGIAELFEGADYQLDESNRSKTGKYISLDLSVEVKDDQQRQEIFDALQEISSVKVVL